VAPSIDSKLVLTRPFVAADSTAPQAHLPSSSPESREPAPSLVRSRNAVKTISMHSGFIPAAGASLADASDAINDSFISSTACKCLHERECEGENDPLTWPRPAGMVSAGPVGRMADALIGLKDDPMARSCCNALLAVYRKKPSFQAERCIALLAIMHRCARVATFCLVAKT
jgi:hypothetical protein